MDVLEMTRDLRMPIPSLALPDGYSNIAIHEENGNLWEEVMDATWGNHQPGAFRYCMVANNGYEEDRVFVLLNENQQPVATSSPWYYGIGHWYKEENPEVAYVGVIPSYQGNGLGKLMVNHSLHELKKRGYSVAHLGIRGTDTGENYPAVKAYLNCGFTPYIVEEAHVAAWETVYRHLSLPLPNLRYVEPARPSIDMPHPSRPWPYQIRCAAEAQKNGDTYIFGLWHMARRHVRLAEQPLGGAATVFGAVRTKSGLKAGAHDMQTKFVYHVVTERPMQLGQKIIFDETHRNGVYNRVMTFKRIADGEDVQGDLADFIKSDMSKWACVAYRELSLEVVRRDEYPDYPSRLACLYTSRTLEEAKKWAQFFKNIGRDVYSIVKLKVHGNIFDGDACNCFDGTEAEEENLDKARHYWRKDVKNEKPVIETLVDGEIIVDEIMEDFHLDIGNYAEHARIWDWSGHDNTAEYEYWRSYAAGYGQHVLIPMCSLGETGAYLAERGFHVTAFDITQEMIDEGKKRFGHLSNLELLYGDIRDFAFHIPPVDFCYIKDLGHLYTIEDVRKAFAAISLHMRPGGGMVIEIDLPSEKSEYFPPKTFYPLKQVYPNLKVWKVGDARNEAETGRWYISQTIYIEDESGAVEQFDHSFYLQRYPREELNKALDESGFEVKAQYRNRDKEPWHEGDRFWIVEAVKIREANLI